MKFDIRVQNFGKIKDAKVKIRPFTVIAGPNSSGKSFITKALYSFFSTINTDHIASSALSSIQRINLYTNFCLHSLTRLSNHEKELFSYFMSLCNEVENIIRSEMSRVEIDDLEDQSILMNSSIEQLKHSHDELYEELSKKQKFNKISSEFNLIKSELEEINNIINNPVKHLERSIEEGFANEIKGNFQLSKLSNLKNFSAKDSDIISFDFDSLGNINFEKKIYFELSKKSVNYFRSLHNVVFLESPLYWRMKNALEIARSNRHLRIARSMKKQDSLTGVPKHFYDLVDLLESGLVSTEYESDVFNDIEKNINSSIGGAVSLSNSGELSYNISNSKNKINLHSTAMGIANLGILSLLINKNIISKGSFILIDEPEINLHPAWQQVMIEALYQLSRNGVNVIIASHSVDMMKYIENIMSKLESDEIENHFGINQLSPDGCSLNDEESSENKISLIKDDLSKPFMNMFMESIWK